MSYFEWVQNIENEQWDLDDVNRKLRRKIERAVAAVIQRWSELQQSHRSHGQSLTLQESDTVRATCIDLRTAALVVAIDRVSRVALERGIWP